MKALSGYKTYIVCGVAILYAIVVTGIQGGDWDSAIKMIMAALGGAGLRAGVSKSGPLPPATGGAAIIATFLILGLTQTGMAQNVAGGSKHLWEPDYTAGLFTLSEPLNGGNGVEFNFIPGLGVGGAYSEVRPSADGTQWITVWSVALDPLYVERDPSGALFLVPGVKGSVFNDFLQVYLGYKIGNMQVDTGRWNVKFATSLTGLWDFVTSPIL